jgi:hypothetical protein
VVHPADGTGGTWVLKPCVCGHTVCVLRLRVCSDSVRCCVLRICALYACVCGGASCSVCMYVCMSFLLVRVHACVAL